MPFSFRAPWMIFSCRCRFRCLMFHFGCDFIFAFLALSFLSAAADAAFADYCLRHFGWYFFFFFCFFRFLSFAWIIDTRFAADYFSCYYDFHFLLRCRLPPCRYFDWWFLISLMLIFMIIFALFLFATFYCFLSCFCLMHRYRATCRRRCADAAAADYDIFAPLLRAMMLPRYEMPRYAHDAAMPFAAADDALMPCAIRWYLVFHY